MLQLNWDFLHCQWILYQLSYQGSPCEATVPSNLSSPSCWCYWIMKYFVVVVLLLSHFWFFATPWTVAHQASLSFTIFHSLLKLVSIESVMPSNHLTLCHPLFLALSLPQHQGLFQWVSSSHQVGPSIGVSTSGSVLPMNIQDWFPWRLTGLISLQSKGLSRVFSNTTVRNINSFALSFLYGSTLTSYIHTWLLEKP